jgi:hypothetical protein
VRKCDEEADPNSCWNRAAPEEEVFVLLGRDPAAAATLRFWAEERVRLGRNKAGDLQITLALLMAGRLERVHK